MAIDQPREPSATYRSLDAAKVIETIAALHRRISERFSGAGLARVCAELLALAEENSTRAHRIAAPNIPLRGAITILLVVGGAALAWIVAWVVAIPATSDGVFSVLQGLEAAANLVVFLGAMVFFLGRLEERLKRRQAIAALHELRSIIHVIDMHQLTKDPSAMVVTGRTASSPQRTLNRADTARYLDYCSEMLSLTAKVAVLFVQGFPDQAVVDNVSDIERLAAGLSQKIWQKIMILQTAPDGRVTQP